MTFLQLLLAFITGGALGWLAHRMTAGSSGAVANDRASRLDASLRDATRLGDQLRSERDAARRDAAVLSERISHLERKLGEAQSNDQRLVGEFERLSRMVLKSSSEELMKTAESTFKLAQQKATGEFDQQRVRIEHLVGPVQENLAKLEAHIQQTEQARKEEYGSLFENMRAVAETNQRVENEARQLKNVLRSSGSQRGRWGEVQLRRVVELAGMLEHCDFAEQSYASVDGESGKEAGRADLVVWLQNNQQIAVDAKAPYDAYEVAQTTDDPALQKQKLAEHATHFRKHVDALSSRKYWEKYQPSCGFAIMFVPGEALLDAALVNDTSLWEHAAEKHILLATPSTLIALLRMAALGWRQQSQAENAEQIVKVGQELHRRLRTAGNHLDKIGRNLRSSVDAYNDYVGSMTSRVLPQSRKLSGLGVGDAELSAPEEITSLPRAVPEGTFEMTDDPAEIEDRTTQPHDEPANT